MKKIIHQQWDLNPKPSDSRLLASTLPFLLQFAFPQFTTLSPQVACGPSRTLKPHLQSPAILLRAIQWSSCASADLARVLLYWSGTTATIKVCLCTTVLSFPVKSGNLELSWRAMTEIEKAQPTKTDGATIFDSSESTSVVKCWQLH